MNDSRSPKGLKDEWSLLVHSFLSDDTVVMSDISEIPFEESSLDKLKLIRKDLSSRRKKLNQNIEKIKIKIAQINSVIENLELVGSDPAGLVKEIDYLNAEGERFSEELNFIDQKIKKTHLLQENILGLNQDQARL